jgi:phosphoenolpyruvate carboxylase
MYLKPNTQLNVFVPKNKNNNTSANVSVNRRKRRRINKDNKRRINNNSHKIIKKSEKEQLRELIIKNLQDSIPNIRMKRSRRAVKLSLSEFFLKERDYQNEGEPTYLYQLNIPPEFQIGTQQLNNDKDDQADVVTMISNE